MMKTSKKFGNNSVKKHAGPKPKPYYTNQGMEPKKPSTSFTSKKQDSKFSSDSPKPKPHDTAHAGINHSSFPISKKPSSHIDPPNYIRVSQVKIFTDYENVEPVENQVNNWLMDQFQKDPRFSTLDIKYQQCTSPNGDPMNMILVVYSVSVKREIQNG